MAVCSLSIRLATVVKAFGLLFFCVDRCVAMVDDDDHIDFVLLFVGVY